MIDKAATLTQSAHSSASEGFVIVDEYCDAAVSGADPVDQRPGFVEMLQLLATNGAKTIIVELSGPTNPTWQRLCPPH